MTPVNKYLNKVAKLTLWVFKPIHRLTSHVTIHKNTFSSKTERFINLLSPSEIHEFSNSILKVVFETSVNKSPIISYWTITKNNSKCKPTYSCCVTDKG